MNVLGITDRRKLQKDLQSCIFIQQDINTHTSSSPKSEHLFITCNDTGTGKKKEDVDGLVNKLLRSSSDEAQNQVSNRYKFDYAGVFACSHLTLQRSTPRWKAERVLLLRHTVTAGPRQREMLQHPTNQRDLVPKDPAKPITRFSNLVIGQGNQRNVTLVWQDVHFPCKEARTTLGTGFAAWKTR